jgi:hypothetical protein
LLFFSSPQSQLRACSASRRGRGVARAPRKGLLLPVSEGQGVFRVRV